MEAPASSEIKASVMRSANTDIRGANNAGLPCCWYNPAGKARPEDLRIDYEIRDLRELLDIV